MREIVIKKIKDRIIYHSDEKKHRFEIGKGVIDKCAEDILNDLAIEELERLAEIGKATKKAFEEGVFLTYALFSYEGEILEYEIQEDVEDLLEWYRGRQTND